MQKIFRPLRSVSRVSNQISTFSSSPAAPSTDKLVIFDTTLRDGEQSPGATLNTREKLQIAKGLSQLGIDICEAGFPIASQGDFEAVELIAKEVGPLETNRSHGPMTIAGLARATEGDIFRCYEAVKHAPRHRIHTFLATSDIHLKYKLNIDRDECIRRAVHAVEYAKSLATDIEFSPEDAGRSDPKFLTEILGEVIKAGATTLNIPDTVGYTIPEEYGNLFEYLIANTEGAENVIFSTHCHNDLGMATANSMAGVRGGARQVEVAMNGIGERAGNTATEEVVMVLQTRPNQYPVHCEIDTTHITRVSRMVSHFTGMSVQPNKAIIGANAFAHESGIHQDGVLKHQETYEIMTPQSVGLADNNMVLGKHSGRHAYKKRLEEMGYTELTPKKLADYVSKFKALADEKKTVTDADMVAIVEDDLYKPETHWCLESIHVTAGNSVKCTATITMSHKDGLEVSEASLGSGPVDALFTAITNITGVQVKVSEYTINSVTQGKDSLGDVTVRVEPLNEDTSNLMKANTNYVGHGANTDIIVASGTAFVNALNRMISSQHLPKAEGATVEEVVE